MIFLTILLFFPTVYHVSYGDQVAMDLISISINGVEEMLIPKFIFQFLPNF